MAGSMNKVLLVGRLGQDPKLSYTTSGQAVANLRMATDEGYKDRQSGQWVDRAEWHSVVVWGQQAEFCSNYLSKGSLLLVEGRLQTRKWQGQDGQDRYTTEIVAQRVQGLDRRQQQEGQSPGGPQPGQASQAKARQRPAQAEGQPEPDEDLGPAFPSEASGMDDVPF
ncbi:MAG: single-stranded DNA-binding protein [Desulfovibrionaceae bacterium]|nr:single-stranded DNA-binding protein [Desulfovibrionaceae bacterium]MDD4951832.1 single-stranded DNA-binding protein [Desulfovibrionaceae bacterium]